MSIRASSIKRDHYERMKRGSVVFVEATDAGFVVHEWHPDGVAPQSTYATSSEAIARVAQLLKVQTVVVPQDWPEEVCVGSINT